MRKIYTETDKEIINMYVDDKKSTREICQIIGVKSHNTVRRILKRNNIEPNKNRVGRSNHKTRKGYKDISGSYFCIIKAGAKVRNLEFALSLKYLQELLEKQNYKCSLSGVQLIFPTCLSIEGRKQQNASLDRIDSNKGYIEGNVQWVHKIINNIKWELSQEDFVLWCNKVTKHMER